MQNMMIAKALFIILLASSAGLGLELAKDVLTLLNAKGYILNKR